MTETITQKELESYLWGAATLLRGLIDASDNKQYIFPLFSSSAFQMSGMGLSASISRNERRRLRNSHSKRPLYHPRNSTLEDSATASRDIGRCLRRVSEYRNG